MPELRLQELPFLSTFSQPQAFSPAHVQEVSTDGAGTLLAGAPERRVLEIVDPGRRTVATKIAGRALLGADSDEGGHSNRDVTLRNAGAPEKVGTGFLERSV